MLLEKLIVRLIGDGSSYRKMLSTAEQSTTKATNSIAKHGAVIDKTTAKISKMGSAAVKTGVKLTTALVVGIVSIGTAAVVSAVQFNQLLANISTLGLSSGRVEELRGEIQQLAIDVGKSTSDIAQGGFDVVSAFGDSADTMKLLEINAKAAKGGIATTAEAIKLTSAVTKGYGDTSVAATKKVADLAFKTNELGQTTFRELAASMGRVTGTAGALGISQEELFTVMATGTGVTGTTAEVSTQLAGILQALTASTDEAKKAFKAAGFESGKAAIKSRGFAGALKILTDASNDTTRPLQSLISSAEGQRLAIALAGSQADVYSEKLEKMKNAAGAADVAFLKQSQGVNKLGASWNKTKVRVEVMAQKLGQALIPIIEKATKKVEELLKPFLALNQQQKEMAILAAASVAALGPFLIVLGTLASAVSSLIGPLITVISLIASFATPVGLMVAAIVTIIGAIALMSNSWTDAFNHIKNLLEGLTDVIISVVRVQGRVWTMFLGFLSKQFEKLYTVDFVVFALKGMRIVAEKMVDLHGFLFRKLRSLITGEESGSLADFFTTFAEDFETGAKAQSLEDLLKGVQNIVTEEAEKLQNKESIKASVNLFKGGADEAQEKLAQVAETAQEFFKQDSDELRGINDGVQEMIDVLREQVTTSSGINVEALNLGGP